MPDEDWKTMTDHLNFTYSGKLLTARLTDDDPFAADLDSYPDLARLYTLGNRLLDSVVRNAVIKEFVRIDEYMDQDPPGHESIDIIYEGTLNGDPARRLMVYTYLHWLNARGVGDKDAENPFLFDVAQTLWVDNYDLEMVVQDVSEYLV